MRHGWAHRNSLRSRLGRMLTLCVLVLCAVTFAVALAAGPAMPIVENNVTGCVMNTRHPALLANATRAVRKSGILRFHCIPDDLLEACTPFVCTVGTMACVRYYLWVRW